MSTVTYGSIKSRVEALMGTTFASAESVRLREFINQRAHEAYLRTVWWPQYLVIGEERTITSKELPRTQTNLDEIEHVIKIESAAPFTNSSSREYPFIRHGNVWEIIDPSEDPSSAYVTYQKVWDGPYQEGDDIPEEWAYFISMAALADVLYMTLDPSEMQRAQMAEMRASQLLSREIQRLDLHGNSETIKKQIRTYLNQSAR